MRATSGGRFSFLRPLLLLTLGAVISACGGGGGGGGGSSAPPPASNPPLPTANPKAFLTSSNATIYSEHVRQFIYSEARQLDLTLSDLGDPGFPQLNFANETSTDPCSVSGSVTVTVAGSGADVEIAFLDCSDTPGEVINGSFRWLFTNANSAAGSFDFTATYTSLRYGFGSDEVVINGESFIHTEVNGNQHVHDLEIDLDLTGSGTDRLFADGLDVTIRHRDSDLEGLEVTAISGDVGSSNGGSVRLEFLTSSGEVRMIGDQSTEAFFLLDGQIYGARFVEPSGRAREVRMDVNRIGELRAQDGINSAPFANSISNTAIGDGQVQQLDYRLAIFDPDFEFLEFELTVVAATPGATIDITQIRDGIFEVTAIDGGNFDLRLSARDGSGASGARNFVLQVLVDTDGDGETDDYDYDDDNDGVPDISDDLPLDPTEYRDSDGDGIGDNADTDDDGDGVADIDDAFPYDPACSSASDGTGDECFLSSIAEFDRFVTDANGVIYFAIYSTKIVYRWDTLANSFLPPWSLGNSLPSDSIPTTVTYVPNQGRIYFGYNNGAITYFEPLSGVEQYLSTLPSSVGGLGDAGNFLLAQDASGAWNTHYIYAADGTLAASEEWNYNSRVYRYSPTEERIYFFRDDQSPRDLHYEQIDQTTGAIVADGETPYHGAYLIEPPIVVSPTGDRILIGSGNMFTAGDLIWAGSITAGIVDAQWSAIDGLIAIYEDGADTRLERRDAASQVVERLPFTGEPRALIAGASGYLVITQTGTSLTMYEYIPSDDSDGDGVRNDADDFPIDTAASVDTDGDGYPDAWNPGASQADSTTGLVIDAYPTESACYLPEHGDGVNCDIASTLPDYRPDGVAIDTGGILYLLSTENERIYRYSAATGQHLSPIVVGTDAPAIAPSPQLMEYAPLHDRLYLGYTSGDITYVDLNSVSLEEQAFAQLPLSVNGLGAAGDFLVAQDPSGAWATHYYFDQSGTLTDSAEWNRQSRDYEWNETLRRVYFFRDSTSPNDLHYEEISTLGAIVGEGESPYHGDYGILPPILISPDDQSVLLGSGDIYLANDLTWSRSLLNSFVAGIWDSNGNLTTARDIGGTSRVDRYDASQVWISEADYVGQPIALLEYPAGYMLVTYDGTEPVFTPIAR